LGTQGYSETRLTSSTNIVRLSPTFGTIGNCRWGLMNMLFSGSTGFTFDLQGIGGSGSAVFEMVSCSVNNPIIYTARTTADFFNEFSTCIHFGTMTFHGGTIGLDQSYLYNDVFIDDVGTTGVNGAIVLVSSSQVAGNVAFNKTRDANFIADSYGNILLSIATSTLTVTNYNLAQNLLYTTDMQSMPYTTSFGTGVSVTVHRGVFDGCGLTLNGTGMAAIQSKFVAADSVPIFTPMAALTGTLYFVEGSISPGVQLIVASSAGASDSGKKFCYSFSTH